MAGAADRARCADRRHDGRDGIARAPVVTAAASRARHGERWRGRARRAARPPSVAGPGAGAAAGPRAVRLRTRAAPPHPPPLPHRPRLPRPGGVDRRRASWSSTRPTSPPTRSPASSAWTSARPATDRHLRLGRPEVHQKNDTQPLGQGVQDRPRHRASWPRGSRSRSTCPTVRPPRCCRRSSARSRRRPPRPLAKLQLHVSAGAEAVQRDRAGRPDHRLHGGRPAGARGRCRWTRAARSPWSCPPARSPAPSRGGRSGARPRSSRPCKALGLVPVGVADVFNPLVPKGFGRRARSPRPGRRCRRAPQVVYQISKGPDLVVVPKLAGLQPAAGEGRPGQGRPDSRQGRAATLPDRSTRRRPPRSQARARLAGVARAVPLTERDRASRGCR